jgi:hypothetical protein
MLFNFEHIYCSLFKISSFKAEMGVYTYEFLACLWLKYVVLLFQIHWIMIEYGTCDLSPCWRDWKSTVGGGGVTSTLQFYIFCACQWLLTLLIRVFSTCCLGKTPHGKRAELPIAHPQISSTSRSSTALRDRLNCSLFNALKHTVVRLYYTKRL